MNVNMNMLEDTDGMPPSVPPLYVRDKTREGWGEGSYQRPLETAA